jgi:hypothetical protein
METHFAFFGWNDNLINLLSNFNPSEYELEIIQANSIIWCNII